MQALEAVLLLAGEPLNSRKISQHANLADGTEALTLIRQLNRLYQAEGRAFRVEQIAGGYQLMTHPVLADWLRRMGGAPVEVRLSAPAMETLAVVAYRQPVLRADIEAIRGVACGEILRQLMERDLVRIDGRSEELGRPFLYGTTNRFLHVFGLGNIDELPRAAALRQPLPGANAAPDASNLEDAALEIQESSTVIATAGNLVVSPQTEFNSWEDEAGEAPTVVAELDDDEDEIDDEFDDDDDDDDFDDDFDDDYDDDDEWDDDELEDEELDDELDEDDEWEEVEDDEDDLDEEDEEDDEDDDWEEDEED